MTEKIARVHDFEGLDKHVRVMMSNDATDSLLFFTGECANIYRVIHIRGKRNKYLLDPEMVAKIEFDSRVFESHKIRVPGKGAGRQCFVEKFFSSAEIEMFEGNNCDEFRPRVSYYVRIGGTRYLNRLDGVCGTINKTSNGQIITDEANIRQHSLLPMSRKSMTAIGAHLATARRAKTFGSSVFRN
ncbi:MAG: hypothetical protein HKN87_13570 [Saprospiraceae bacterium]|nr:hypothetical protein [Saprospiraceae bacterium]